MPKLYSSDDEDFLFWIEIEKQKKEIAAKFDEAAMLVKDHQMIFPNIKEFNELLTNIEDTKYELLNSLIKEKGESLSDGMCSSRSWATKTRDKTRHFAEELVLTVKTVTDPKRPLDHLPRQLERLHHVARGSIIPPKVKLAVKSMLAGLAFIAALSSFWKITGAFAAIMSSGPLGIAVIAATMLGGATYATYSVYHSGKNAKRAQVETDQRNTKLKLSNTLNNCMQHSMLFSPKKSQETTQTAKPVSSSELKPFFV